MLGRGHPGSIGNIKSNSLQTQNQCCLCCFVCVLWDHRLAGKTSPLSYPLLQCQHMQFLDVCVEDGIGLNCHSSAKITRRCLRNVSGSLPSQPSIMPRAREALARGNICNQFVLSTHMARADVDYNELQALKVKRQPSKNQMNGKRRPLQQSLHLCCYLMLVCSGNSLLCIPHAPCFFLHFCDPDNPCPLPLIMVLNLLA